VRRTFIALAGATLFLASACGGDDEPTAYTDEMRSDFMSQCTTGAGDGAEDMCKCTYDALVETMPFEDFKAYDEAISDDPATALPAEVTEAMTECATASVELPNAATP
jgi:hypothetical protein